jgi:simple sugar transport system ATP-binding protein
VEALFTVVRGLRERGVAVLFVSHKLREMLQVSDRFTILRNGGVVARGEAANFDAATITLHMTGREVDGTRSPREPRRKDPLLEVRHLAGEVVRNVGFELHPGEIVGLTGLLGSGQTELAEMLFGLRRPLSGDVFLHGERTELRSVRDAMAAGVAYVPEDRLTEGLFLEQPVEDNLLAASLDALSGRAGLLAPARIHEQVRHWLDALDIRTESPRTPAWALSGGNQQRVVLGRWLATAPALLILNGPTVGVDVGSREGIHRRLRELAAGGLGILLISDDLPELVETSHRVLVLHQGAIVDELRGDDCREEALALRLSRLE